MTSLLSKTDHRRDLIGLKYVYPVHSRRSGGLSIGINLNTNNACNWRCIYCQVPNLTKGAAPEVDFNLLEKELTGFLEEVMNGSFYEEFKVPPEEQVIKDFAISGNGEPTSLKNFDELIQFVGKITSEFKQKNPTLPAFKLVLITNGSLLHLPQVQKGLHSWNELGGEVWFKLDSATLEGRLQINNFQISNENVLRNILISLKTCQTKIQTCLLDGAGPGTSETEKKAYQDFLSEVQKASFKPEIMFYTIARTSHQPESEKIKALSFDEMNAFASTLQNAGWTVRVAK